MVKHNHDLSMNPLIDVLKELSKSSVPDNFDWLVPSSCPISIPEEYEDGYSRNIFLKNNFHEVLINDETLASHYWVIRDWGRIGSFKKSETNDQRIKKFLRELDTGILTRQSFDRISSLSKVASFLAPDEFAIYDSRAIYALNWLIFNYSSSKELFPQPVGRSSDLAKYDLQTIFRLSKLKFSYRSHKVAFHQYCELMKQLGSEVFGPASKPYQVEMLLFMIAPTIIIQKVESSVTLTISQ